MADGHEPATKADLKAVEEKLEEKIEMLRSEMNHGYADLKETLRDNETKLLAAFYSFAESNQKRVAEIETESAAIKSRLATIEDRLLQVERRVNFPNTPPQ